MFNDIGVSVSKVDERVVGAMDEGNGSKMPMDSSTPAVNRKPKVRIQINGQDDTLFEDFDQDETYKGDDGILNITPHLDATHTENDETDQTCKMYDSNEDVNLMASILESTGVADIDPTVLRNVAKALTKHLTE